MAIDINGFNAAEVEPSDMSPIPAGKYTAAIVASESKPTKSGTGEYLQFTFQILDGAYKGRMLWARLNLDNPNQTAVQIARQELSAICRAVGVLTPKAPVELHNLPMSIRVAMGKNKDTGETTNEIKGYEKLGGAAPTGAPSAAAAAGTPPWKRQGA